MNQLLKDYFAKYLHLFGYKPIVLTRDGVGPNCSDTESLELLNGTCEITRAKPWDNDDLRIVNKVIEKFVGTEEKVEKLREVKDKLISMKTYFRDNY